jgi:ElaB/YqjD/DUF883 family membrane-anchored ribosome-binding protein
MGEDPGAGSTAVTGTPDQEPAAAGPREPEEIQREIEETREQLGDTVEALAQKADVKAQAKQKFEETKTSVSEKKEQLFGKARETAPEDVTAAAAQASQKAQENPLPVAAAAAFGVGFLIGRLTRR